jgi:predicted Holliday junction resolvase-like endonuclease
VDPLTLLALANGAVQAVKKGCQLYKDIKSAAGDVSSVLKDIDKQFAGRKVSKEQAAKIAEKKAEFREAANTDPNDVISRIGNQLGDFFEAFDKIEQLFYEEERNANKVYEGEDSVSKRALQRVLIRSRLTMMEAEMRELMIYHSPPELKDLWTRFEAMRAQIGQEQKRAWEKLRIERQQEAAEQKKEREFYWGIGAWLVSVTVIWLYLILLLWAIARHRENSFSLWWVT